MRRLALIACPLLVAVLLAGSAAAAGPPVHAFALKMIQRYAGDGSYLPTRIPAGYRYLRWELPAGNLVVTFWNKRNHDQFTFQVRPLPKGMECDLQGSFHRTLQLDGNKVYYGGWDGDWVAWRCVTSPKTHKRYLLEVHSRGPLPDVALARVAASGKRVAR